MKTNSSDRIKPCSLALHQASLAPTWQDTALALAQRRHSRSQRAAAATRRLAGATRCARGAGAMASQPVRGREYARQDGGTACRTAKLCVAVGRRPGHRLVRSGTRPAAAWGIAGYPGQSDQLPRDCPDRVAFSFPARAGPWPNKALSPQDSGRHGFSALLMNLGYSDDRFFHL